jgi:voltage-gated potassium channel Kch
VFDAAGLRSAFVEGVVIDIDRESTATIAGLRQVFPELRIVALSSSASAAA